MNQYRMMSALRSIGYFAIPAASGTISHVRASLPSRIKMRSMCVNVVGLGTRNYNRKRIPSLSITLACIFMIWCKSKSMRRLRIIDYRSKCINCSGECHLSVR